MLRYAIALFCALAGPAVGQSLQSQLAEAQAAAVRYADFTTARREGWRPFGGEAPLMGRHYQHRSGPDYVHGDRIDFSRPSNLVYATIGGQQRLVALAYIVRIAPDEPLPAGFAGGADIWHVHDGVKFINAVRESRPLVGGLANRWFQDAVVQADGRSRLAMVHVWLIANPKGRFASHNPAIAYYDLGLPYQWAADGDMEVARGIALAQRKGCENALSAELWIAGVDGRRKRDFFRLCEEGAAAVRASLGGSEAQVESVARQAWRRIEDAKVLWLSSAEKQRIAAFVEDGPGICR